MQIDFVPLTPLGNSIKLCVLLVTHQLRKVASSLINRDILRLVVPKFDGRNLQYRVV